MNNETWPAGEKIRLKQELSDVIVRCAHASYDVIAKRVTPFQTHRKSVPAGEKRTRTRIHTQGEVGRMHVAAIVRASRWKESLIGTETESRRESKQQGAHLALTNLSHERLKTEHCLRPGTWPTNALEEKRLQRRDVLHATDAQST